MISNVRHDEVSHKTGKHVIIIKTFKRDPETRQITNELNKEYFGERWKVRFSHGVGRTTDREIGRRMSEELEYVVFLHKDAEPWPEVKEVNGEFIYEIEDSDDAAEIYEGEE